MDMVCTSMRPAEQVTGDLQTYGYHVFEHGVDALAASELLADIRATRRFDESLFLSEAAFDADPQYTGVNPRPGRNLLDRFEDRLSFVEGAPQIVEALTGLLGADYQTLDRKIVCGVPAKSTPAWLRARIEGRPVNNLGAYVRPDLRDITYFHGIDFHQDLIDYKDSNADFLTVYVYLHPVGVQDAPLHLLEGSHRLGASVFPHDLEPTGPSAWRYGDGRGAQAEVRQRVLTGPTGFVALWHACTLHGTKPDAADIERISLRYLFGSGPGSTGRLSGINRALRGPLSLSATRTDLADNGAALMKRNSVSRA